MEILISVLCSLAVGAGVFFVVNNNVNNRITKELEPLKDKQFENETNIKINALDRKLQQINEFLFESDQIERYVNDRIDNQLRGVKGELRTRLMNELDQEFSVTVGQLNARLQTLEKELVALKPKVSSLEARPTPPPTREEVIPPSLQNSIAQQQKLIAQQQGAIVQLQGMLGQQQRVTAQLQTDMQSVINAFNILKAEHDQLQSEHKTLQTKYDAALAEAARRRTPEPQPSETQPSETQPSETQRSETQRSETQPSEPQPSETQPSETQPSEPQPSETQPSETQPSETQPSETQPSETQPSEPQPSSFQFDLPEPTQITFNGTRDEILAKLKQTLDMDDIVAFLRKRSKTFKDADSLLESFNDYLDRQKKFFHAFADGTGKWGKLDDDQLSEKVTEEFFENVRSILLENIMISISRSNPSAHLSYGRLLKLLNSYLKKFGVYTKPLTVGTKLAREMRAFIVSNGLIRRKTPDSNLDMVIAKVERLPYFIAYEDDSGKREMFFCGGWVVIWKYEGGK